MTYERELIQKHIRREIQGKDFAQRKIQPDFIEAKSIEEANAVDKSVYRLERFSESRNCYIFVKRTR